MIERIFLPENLNIDLLGYFEKVLQRPSKYIYKPLESNIIGNVYDNTLPGISDEYILNNHSSETYKNFSLQTTQCSNFSEIAFPPMHISSTVIDFLESYMNRKLIYPSGNFFYPLNGFMGWHTNSNSPGIRIYIAYSPIENGSCFKYYDSLKQEVITDWDLKGITVRKFEIPSTDSRLWHCVHALHSPRISFGYLFGFDEIVN